MARPDPIVLAEDSRRIHAMDDTRLTIALGFMFGEFEMRFTKTGLLDILRRAVAKLEAEIQ